MLGAAPSIQTKYIFGQKADTNGSVFHIDEQKIIYTAGHNVVIYNTEDKLMQFFPGLDTSLGITSIALSPLRRHLAVAERAEPAAIIVYDTHTQRKKRMMSTPDCLSNEYVSMAFAPGQENKYLITMGGAPDWMLVYWQWERPRVLTFIQVSSGNPVYQISFNLLDHNNGIIVTGQDVFRWYKIQENVFKPQATDIHSKPEILGTNYLCHAWLKDGRLVVGNETGEILILDANCEYLGYIKIALEGFEVTSILYSERGFVVGGTKGRILIFDSLGDERKPDYKQRPRIIQTEKKTNAKVKGMSLSFQTEEFLVITLDNSQIYSIEFNSPNEEADYLSQTFHSGAITGMDVCVRKPLVVTCGTDNYVRIWNYLERTLEVSAHYAEEPFSVAFHPSGFHIVVGFADKLRMMIVFHNYIKPYQDISIRACAEVRFSNGGHLFAATNGSYIKVYNFYTGENPPNMEFKGHSGKVRSIAWNEDDTSFVSAGMDGTVYEWKINPKNGVTHPNHQKGVNYSSVIMTSESSNGEGKSIYAVGNDKYLKEICEGNEVRRIETRSIIGQIALTHSGKLLFAGVNDPTKTGAVWCYKFSPLTGDYTEYQAHSSGIERIRVSHDDCFLFTAGQDGCLIIWEIKDKDIRALRREKEALGLPYAEEVLMTRVDIDELNQQIESLRTTNRDMVTNSKMQYELNLQDKADLIEKLREQLVNDAQQDKNRYDSLAESKREMEQQYDERIRGIKEQYELERQELETKQQQDFMLEVGRYQELSRDKDMETKAAEEAIKNLEKRHAEELSHQKDDFEQQIKEEDIEVKRLEREFEDTRKRHQYILKQLQEEDKQEVTELRMQNEADTKQIKEESLKAKGKLSMAKRKETMLQAEKDRLEDEIKAKREEKDHQDKQINQQREQLNKMKNIIADKEKEIGEREKKIYELKQNNQNLEKFKFVLDYKIRELKQEIGPREKEIAEMKEQTSDMDKRLKFLSGLNESLGGFMDELCQTQDNMQHEISEQRDRIRKSQNKIKAIRDGIYDCAQNIQDFRKLKESILKLFSKYVKTEGRGQEPDTEKEFARQCEYLQNSIDSLRKKLKEVTEKHQQENMKMMKVNAELIEEIYKLREERKKLSGVKRQYELLTQKTQPRRSAKEEENIKIMEKQKEEIRELRKKIQEIESGRPQSQGRLPPLENPSWAQD